MDPVFNHLRRGPLQGWRNESKGTAEGCDYTFKGSPLNMRKQCYSQEAGKRRLRAKVHSFLLPQGVIIKALSIESPRAGES